MPTSQPDDAFDATRARLEAMCSFMGGEEAGSLTHSEVEKRLAADGRELLRQLYQDHLDLRAAREQRLGDVVDARGTARGTVETGHARPLMTVFGEVDVSRLAYRHRGEDNLYPADAALNLPVELHSHGLREIAAVESARGSFGEAAGALRRSTGARCGKRQVEQLAARSAVDFEAFYESTSRAVADQRDVLALSADGKGIVVRPGALRPATAKAAGKAKAKLKTRLSKGEKRARKRIAEVGAVYDVAPVPRAPADIIGRSDEAKAPAPRATNKWLTASVVDDAGTVISSVFDEAQRRDPTHKRCWVALVDGAGHQIDCINAEAKARKVEVHIVCDFVHVLEYLWRAAWSFFKEGDPAAEAWVAEKATAVLEGKAPTVAASVRRKATSLDLGTKTRENADKCADYLLAKKKYLNYPRALAEGWPIATGIIEGACRHLVKDRLDLTGSRWGLNGAETILKLRALRSNGDFDEYWKLCRSAHNFHYVARPVMGL
jgi:hypothetical protein